MSRMSLTAQHQPGRKYNTDVQDVEGCTVLHIISRRAVYTAHFCGDVGCKLRSERSRAEGGWPQERSLQNILINVFKHSRNIPDLESRPFDDKCISAS
ncbi:hypothetical protein BO86DRAFT_391406 [Aspergillus japonicus CBS 114.51]|uniref:Uncharacterized protein n=1 Tax=Aspergillus japonicus CBS 114.51 TaxID=1448312 RepID=A0A8T8WT84_ASPJA|nr:hypothetical protein BO86DRAFT_391406 [Aspergillus japonicus CBS 114.51]RAH78953.1 hypothetical protein BO86DRAFT_391406 [Aspergillus japonicus CBS 114.51]